jgi:hypothetical protein
VAAKPLVDDQFGETGPLNIKFCWKLLDINILWIELYNIIYWNPMGYILSLAISPLSIPKWVYPIYKCWLVVWTLAGL